MATVPSLRPGMYTSLYLSSPYRLRPVLQRSGSIPDDAGCLIHGYVGQRPVAALDDVANGGEESLVVAGPELWAEDYVSKLCPVGNLFIQ